MCVPGPTHEAITSGVVLAVAVTITRWSRTADSSAGAMRVSTTCASSLASPSARSRVRFHRVSLASGSCATMARAVSRASAPAPTSSASCASLGARYLSVSATAAAVRKPCSTAATATAKGILARNASSGTTRSSIGEHALQTPLGLGERFPEVVQLLPETEADVVRQLEVVAPHEQHVVLGPHLLHQ